MMHFVRKLNVTYWRERISRYVVSLQCDKCVCLFNGDDNDDDDDEWISFYLHNPFRLINIYFLIVCSFIVD